MSSTWIGAAMVLGGGALVLREYRRPTAGFLAWRTTVGMAAAVAMAVAGGCGPQPDAFEDAARPDVLAEAPGEPVPPVDNRFDPSVIETGQELLGLSVARADISPAADGGGYVGEVEFAGEVTLTGRFRGHPAYPAPGADLVCFFVDGETAAKLPRFAGDERFPWFCFNNRDDAVRALGPPDTEGAATIVVDDYRTVRSPLDVFDTATLVEVLSVSQDEP